jgi:hypothetical protein
MEAAELIVNAWLQMKGYFVMTNIRVDEADRKGRKKPELDILAIKLKKNKKEVESKLHVEVTVSVHPYGRWDEEYLEEILKKFNEERRKRWVERYIGRRYKKLLVMSDRCLPRDLENFENTLKKNGIDYKCFSEIIKDLKEMLKGKSYDDFTRRFLTLIFEHEDIKKKNKF